MELPEIIYPPNRPLERLMKPSQTPVLYNFYLFIEANRNGEFTLGCSNVAATYWESTLFHYKNFESAKENLYNSYFITTSTTSDAKYMSDDCILLAEQNGNIKVLIIPDSDLQLSMECKCAYNKDDRIMQLSVWNENKFVACTESYIHLYDINGASIKSNTIYRNYHTDTIFSIDANKSNEHLFVSASADKKACIWDIRMDVPATVIHCNEFSSLTSIVWHPINKDYVVIGSDAGDIYLLNIKEPKDVVASMHCFNNSIHKMCFNSQEHLAVCGNTSEILVYNCHNEQFTKSYENQDHNTVIRGLTWYKDSLYSCGFNKKLASHCC